MVPVMLHYFVEESLQDILLFEYRRIESGVLCMSVRMNETDNSEKRY
jgi:hypothetical protein